jgi:hypothetical protein
VNAFEINDDKPATMHTHSAARKEEVSGLIIATANKQGMYNADFHVRNLAFSASVSNMSRHEITKIRLETIHKPQDILRNIS